MLDQQQWSRLPEVAGNSRPCQHPQDLTSSTSYFAMNALLKQLHLERLQRLQPVSQPSAGITSGS